MGGRGRSSSFIHTMASPQDLREAEEGGGFRAWLKCDTKLSEWFTSNCMFSFFIVPFTLGLFLDGKAGMIHNTELSSELTGCTGGVITCACIHVCMCV